MNEKLTVVAMPLASEIDLAAKCRLAEEARALNRDPNAAGTIAELRRVVADILARVEWLERQVEHERHRRAI